MVEVAETEAAVVEVEVAREGQWRSLRQAIAPTVSGASVRSLPSCCPPGPDPTALGWVCRYVVAAHTDLRMISLATARQG